jgi:hypothetical protein
MIVLEIIFVSLWLFALLALQAALASLSQRDRAVVLGGNLRAASGNRQLSKWTDLVGNILEIMAESRPVIDESAAVGLSKPTG